MGFTYVSCNFQLVILVKKMSEKPAYGKSGGVDAMQDKIFFRFSAYEDIFWVV